MLPQDHGIEVPTNPSNSPFTSEIYAKKDSTRVTRSMAKSRKKA